MASLEAEHALLLETNQRLMAFVSTASDVRWKTDAEMRVTRGERIIKDEGAEAAEWVVGTTVGGKSTLEAPRRDPAGDAATAMRRQTVNVRKPYRGFEFSLPVRGGTARTVTRRKQDQETTSLVARHDSLTGLPNRTLFHQRMAQALHEITPVRTLAVHCIDLDRFNAVNDTLGYSIGDTLLKTVANRLRECTSGADTVARLGDDEFVVIQTGVESRADVSALATRMLDSLAATCLLGGHEVNAQATIGLAVYPTDGTTGDDLLRHADIALYRAKLTDAGNWCFFDPSMGAQVAARLAVEEGMRQALLQNEFELFYQPLYNVQSREIVAIESLIRWRHPSRGLVMPDEFIPIAEETGLIVPIGEWVLKTACAAAAQWPSHISVAVNISPAQFKSKNLAAATRQALDASGLPGSRLEIEITEAVLMLNSDEILKVLHELRDMGVRISMDDFGTGHSSLSYLSSFPFDKIKIDQSFVRDLTSSSVAAAIVRAVSGLGNSLNLATTAEGVETNEQLAILTADGCTEVQGFLFGRPVPKIDLERLLANKPGGDEDGLLAEDLRSRFGCVPAVAGAECLFEDVACDRDVLHSQPV